MVTELKNLFRVLLAQDKGEDDVFLRNDTGRSAHFSLMYKNMLVGHLVFADGKWAYRYAEDFKSKGLNPIIGFPDFEKCYESEALWPFFAYRIPSLKQPSVQTILAKEKIGSNDQIKLLERFGRQTIANPFELIACSA
jgi:HipA-like protein